MNEIIYKSKFYAEKPIYLNQFYSHKLDNKAHSLWLKYIFPQTNTWPFFRPPHKNWQNTRRTAQITQSAILHRRDCFNLKRDV